MKNLLYLLVISISQALSGQQDQQLFLMHYLGESNFLNPAVQSDCKWFIGLPIISSVHANYANSAFSYKQLIKTSGDSTYTLDIDGVVNNLSRRSIIDAEVQTTILALGYKRNNSYFAFSIIDKLNLPVTFPKDAVSLIWKGNTQFEGTEASLRGSAVNFTYYREYAFGLSKGDVNHNFKGLKGKLLFGKLNLSVPNSGASLYTDPSTFDLTFKGPVNINMSAPIIINEINGKITSFSYDQNVSLSKLLLNRKNWGIAFDLGFIKQYNKKTIISGSILDLGFIRWRSNLNNIKTNGQFFYKGPLGDSTITTTYVNDLITAFQDSMHTEITNNAYTTFLPTKFYLGASYAALPKINAGILFSGVLYETKFVTAATVSGDYNPFRHFHVLLSYSLMYKGYNNIGLGFSLGRGPVQFYAVSDNIAGIIWPLYARNINLRFGLNINLGCNVKSNNESTKWPAESPGTCPCYRQDEIRDQLKAGWNKN
jgi:hypothetical protein